MAETVTRLLEMVRDRLDEPAARQWTEKQLRGWIIDGIRDIATKTQHLLDTVTVAMTAGTGEYTLVESVLVIHGAYWYPTGDTRRVPLTPKAYNAMDNVWWTARESASAADPGYYTTWGYSPQLKLRIWPTPSTNGTCELKVARLPATFDLLGSQDANVVDVPAGWAELAAYFVEFTALRKDRDSRWTEAKALYDEKIAALIENGDVLTQGNEVVWDTPNGFLPGWLVNGDGGW